MPDSDKLCDQCGIRSGHGLIFCKKCGATLRPPTSLIKSVDEVTPHDVIPNIVSPVKRFAANVVKVIAGIAGAVAFLCPLSTGTQILVFAGSIAIVSFCLLLLYELDDGYVSKMKGGYWPAKPMDWNPRPNRRDPGEGAKDAS